MSIPASNGIPFAYYHMSGPSLWDVQKSIARDPQQTPYQGYLEILKLLEGNFPIQDESKVVSCILRMGLSTCQSMRQQLVIEFNELFTSSKFRADIVYDEYRCHPLAEAKLESTLCLFSNVTNDLLAVFPKKN
ncbi:hypothetical protein D5018_20100 [Parashewanella curva]|uniref:Uncharacterized protein n=1 Tax=Parashewanella curva TaxID=2338552 RepID=A0A3L8PRB3_9GAMM|nr:hypothetical protein [Parashewanella curva]RLV57906.1 hypothetical protein D5018_20100 [Parashewanella curva]